MVGVFLLSLVTGCASDVLGIVGPAPEGPLPCSVSSAFATAERAELDRAATDLRTFTGGGLDIVLVGDGDAHDVTIERGPAGERFGFYSRPEKRIRIDADGMYAAGFDARSGVRAMALNLAGQLAGIHPHDGRGAFGAEDVTPDFTDADRAACTAANVCR